MAAPEASSIYASLGLEMTFAAGDASIGRSRSLDVRPCRREDVVVGGGVAPTGIVRIVPSLSFYAAGDDWSAVLETIFGLGLFRVLEYDSEPDRELREFHAPAEVPDGPRGGHLALFHHGRAKARGGCAGATRTTNTEKRAAAWSATLQRLGDPAEWDWAAVTSASGRLNRAVRRMAVNKIGSHPVLPHAARFIAHTGLRYEYGTGIHAAPINGLRGDR